MLRATLDTLQDKMWHKNHCHDTHFCHNQGKLQFEPSIVAVWEITRAFTHIHTPVYCHSTKINSKINVAWFSVLEMSNFWNPPSSSTFLTLEELLTTISGAFQKQHQQAWLLEAMILKHYECIPVETVCTINVERGSE